MNVKFVLLDVEGTTSDINFVKNVLFPYSYEKLPEYVEHHAEDPFVASVVEQVRQEKSDLKTIECVVGQLREWIDNDVKHPALKSIQGPIWKVGFENGDFKSHVYPEIPTVFEKWTSQGIKLGIYSSGSIQAQKLYFKYTEAGDLSSYLSYHFDLSTGPKREKTSYEKILQEIAIAPNQVMFVSDVVAELDAAAAAGISVVHSKRPGISETDKYQSVTDFSDLF